MSNSEQTKSTGSLVVDDDDRSQIRAYPKMNKFRVGDRVKVINSDGARAGPYYVASIASAKMYNLSDQHGQPAQDGHAMEESDLEAA